MKSTFPMSLGLCQTVAPHWGAWIEITNEPNVSRRVLVAPHWGAWIEIRNGTAGRGDLPGRTPLGCVD